MNVQILGLEEVAKIKCNDKGSYLEASLKLPALEIGSLHRTAAMFISADAYL